MSARFSLLIPTRHRPQFIAQGLHFIGAQSYGDFEVIVSDNFEDPSQSCRRAFEEAGLARAVYIRPERPLGMVDHWNFILDHAKGDYVLYFTDKMFLLPGTLARLANAVEETGADLLSWVDDSYIPDSASDYFGPGYYRQTAHGVANGAHYEEFDPREELSRKGRAEVSRPEQSRSAYARGKICFGAYSTSLIHGIKKKYGALFLPISPDYTSMILGLSEANRAVEIGASGIVHMQTDISNGALSAMSDAVAFSYLQQMGDMDKVCGNMLVPGLYAAPHNGVSHDYLALRRKYGLSFDFDAVNWLTYIIEDLDINGRIWSSPAEDQRQRKILQTYMEQMDESAHMRVTHQLAARKATREASVNPLKVWAKKLLPAVYDQLSRVRGRRGRYFSDIRTAVNEIHSTTDIHGK